MNPRESEIFVDQFENVPDAELRANLVKFSQANARLHENPWPSDIVLARQALKSHARLTDDQIRGLMEFVRKEDIMDLIVENNLYSFNESNIYLLISLARGMKLASADSASRNVKWARVVPQTRIALGDHELGKLLKDPKSSRKS